VVSAETPILLPMGDIFLLAIIIIVLHKLDIIVNFAMGERIA